MDTLDTCPYCNRRLCGAISGDTGCSQFPDVSGKITAEIVSAAKNDWGQSECESLCKHSKECNQVVITGANTHLTPLFKGVEPEEITDEMNYELHPAQFVEETVSMGCAGFTAR